MPEPDRVHVVAHVERLGVGADLLDVHVHGHEVAGHDRPIDVLQHGVGLAEAVDLGVDLLVGDDRRGDGHSKVVAGPGSSISGRTSTSASKDQLALFLPGGDVDVGLGDGVDQGVGDGAGVEVGHRFANRLGAQRLAAHPGGRSARSWEPCPFESP